MKTGYLTEDQIAQMAEYAAQNYELSAEWRKAYDAAREYAAEEFGIRANESQVNYAGKLARTIWEGEKIRVQAAIAIANN